jgi:acetyl-CoA carboxylase biotin carboxyl carrier protein
MAKKPPKTSPKPATTAASGDLGVLKELVALLDSSSVTSIKLARGEVIYEVSRVPMPTFASLPPAPATYHAPAAAALVAGGVAPDKPASNLTEIKSPMVGTYYRAPEPGADPYVKIGSRVTPGQTLCIIEAMKIMNEIESEVSGTIRELAVEDASPVEFGQVLFRVEPNV